MIHIYCGGGKGKTTAAIGLTVRMAGHGKRIMFVQFMKGSYTGELKMLMEAKNIKVMRCDRQYGFFRSMTDDDKDNIIHCHNANLKYIQWNMENFDMIVLDEVFSAYNHDLLDRELLRDIVDNYKGELILTGRDPEEWFTSRADYISEIKKIKHPYDNGVKAREGIEF